MLKIVNRLKKGFTLAELMATILILGIISSIAIPTYREYVIRAKMVEVVTVLEHLLSEAKQQYVSSSTIPTSVGGITSGAADAYNGSDCIDFIIYDDGASWANAGRAALVQAVISNECGRGIQGFAPGTVSGAYNTVSMAFVIVGETMQQYCGSWVEDGTEVPLKYLPNGCQSSDFAATVTG